METPTGSASLVPPLAGISVLVLALVLPVTRLLRQRHRIQRHLQALTRYRDGVARMRRKQRVTQLSAVEEYWARVRGAAAPVLVTTPAGVIVAASKGTAEMFGYPGEEELKRVPITELYVNPADRTQYVSPTLRDQGQIRSAEFRMKRRDGTEIRVLANVRVVSMSDGGTYYEGVLTDITALREAVEQRQQLEAQLHLARKLELIGQLASGIAHEINTPLQFIGDNAVFLKSAFDKLTASFGSTAHGAREAGGSALQGLQGLLHDVSDAFRDTFEGVQRVRETVQAMKEFAHPGDLEIASTDLNQAIRTTLIVARNEYKHAADVKTVFGDIPPVDCRRAEINKVLLNLIVNAAHAIEAIGKPGRGTITISSSTEEEHVRIDIADTGCGIPAAVMPRIFDPFFTTKAVGKGSGQGLAIARSIIESHRGELTVSSTVGQGATFTIKLPATPAAHGAAVAADAPNVDALIG
jgi:two-component system, NtrC family, sensor kinase